MRPLSMDHETARDLFLRQLTDFLDACRDLGDVELLDPSHCRGWSRLELVEHVRMGLAEMAVTAGALTDRPADHDAATYWAGHPDDRDEDPVPHVMWLRRTASAYGRPTTAVRRLRDVADSLVTVVAQTPDRTVLFQGKAMRMGDFIATWVAELAIHQLDLATTADAPAGLSFARRTVEAVADADLPRDLPVQKALLAAVGRTAAATDITLSPAFPVTL